MGRIATLIYKCPNCGSFSGSPGECPDCGIAFEPVAAINVYELHQLIKKIATPEGVVNLLEMFREHMER